MRDSREFETPRSPWAFFLPVLLAVLIGQLAANWLSVRLWPAAPVETAAAVVSEAPAQAPVVDPAPLPTPVAAVPPADPVAVLPAPAPGDPEVTPAPAERASSAEPIPAWTGATPADAGPEPGRELPGPVTARQAGASESCINNTVATRSPNGWEQSLENDAPVRCTAISP
ncbi:hypothetical protein CMZ82_15820 [Lysobacteraceae bacterium NML93-0792]|nr:hypothetical protein CMZ82_15820 [Xanthomonadaceae bacterium NML93-0792]PBS15700.1 hypothetical protein CMZ81_08775 [Xanthomonadaceae bacterium NML93-0793]PBS18591.1 hypothetical protein CMZ80_11765 [Xanthomonadaceae bacterium NML93-0831]